MARISNLDQYPISDNYTNNYFLGTDTGNDNQTVNYTFNGLVEYLDEAVTGNISLLTFNVNNDMHLIMQLETNTNLNFELDDNGHLILYN